MSTRGRVFNTACVCVCVRLICWYGNYQSKCLGFIYAHYVLLLLLTFPHSYVHKHLDCILHIVLLFVSRTPGCVTHWHFYPPSCFQRHKRTLHSVYLVQPQKKEAARLLLKLLAPLKALKVKPRLLLPSDWSASGALTLSYLSESSPERNPGALEPRGPQPAARGAGRVPGVLPPQLGGLHQGNRGDALIDQWAQCSQPLICIMKQKCIHECFLLLIWLIINKWVE